MKLISSKELLRTPIFWVTYDKAKDPDGFVIERAIVQHAGSAVMMAVDDKKRILLVKQYRLPARKFLWELPAGRMDKGESALKAAKRELLEETGCKARKWTKLGKMVASPGYVAEVMNLYLAQDLTLGEATPMEDERIEVGWFSVRQMGEMIKSGEIWDAKTIVGFHLYRAKKL